MKNGVMRMKTYQAGIDIGSTTVKLVLLESFMVHLVQVYLQQHLPLVKDYY